MTGTPNPTPETPGGSTDRAYVDGVVVALTFARDRLRDLAAGITYDPKNCPLDRHGPDHYDLSLLLAGMDRQTEWACPFCGQEFSA